MDEFLNNDDIIKRILQNSNRPVKVIDNKERKEVGDRVIVLDYSSATHLNGDELTDTDYDNILDVSGKGYYVVAATGKKVLFKTYQQDAIIANPKTNEQFRITSKHLKIYYKD